MSRTRLRTYLRTMKFGLKWVFEGCPIPAHETIKLSILRNHLLRSDLKIFVETGTFTGWTLKRIADLDAHCYSIELDDELYMRAKEKLSNYSNIELLHGDSSELIPKILLQIDAPALFWLDAHYSGEGTAQAEIDTPINAELSAILDHRIKSHVILIDDARDFDGTNGYPHLDELLRHIRDNTTYKATIHCDIICLKQ